MSPSLDKGGRKIKRGAKPLSYIHSPFPISITREGGQGSVIKKSGNLVRFSDALRYSLFADKPH